MLKSNFVITKKRVYVGAQNCQLFNPTTHLLYANLTQYQLKCLIFKPEVNYFNASILVSNEYGRSLAAPNTFYVSPDDNLYNFQTYAGQYIYI